MDFLWIICIFLLAANQNCGCNEAAGHSRGANACRSDCSCCASEDSVMINDCSCEVPQPLMPGASGDYRTAQYPFPPYPVLRE